MCLICLELNKDKLTFKEAWSNYLEMKKDLEPAHKRELRQKIIDKMVAERSEQKNRRAQNLTKQKI